MQVFLEVTRASMQVSLEQVCRSSVPVAGDTVVCPGGRGLGYSRISPVTNALTRLLGHWRAKFTSWIWTEDSQN